MRGSGKRSESAACYARSLRLHPPPFAQNELYIKTNMFLDASNRDTFLANFKETNTTAQDLVTGTTLAEILNITSNSTARFLWQMLIDLEFNETVSHPSLYWR